MLTAAAGILFLLGSTSGYMSAAGILLIISGGINIIVKVTKNCDK